MLQRLQVVGILDRVFLILDTIAVEGTNQWSEDQERGFVWGEGEEKTQEGRRDTGHTRSMNASHPHTVSSFHLPVVYRPASRRYHFYPVSSPFLGPDRRSLPGLLLYDQTKQRWFLGTGNQGNEKKGGKPKKVPEKEQRGKENSSLSWLNQGFEDEKMDRNHRPKRGRNPEKRKDR